MYIYIYIDRRCDKQIQVFQTRLLKQKIAVCSARPEAPGRRSIALAPRWENILSNRAHN